MENTDTKAGKPFVSFVIATFQNLDLVPELVSTSRHLKDFPCEFCVSDGGSTDGTLRALEAIDDIHIIRSSPDRGIYDAWNFAVPACRGEYISFIGIDDQPQREFLKCARTRFEQGSTPSLFYGDAIYKNGCHTVTVRSPNRSSLLDGGSVCFDIPHPGSLNHKSLFEGQLFDSSFRLAGDLEFYVRLRSAIREGGYCYLPLPQAVIDANGVSRTPKSIPTYLAEFARIEEIHKVKIDYPRLKLRILSILGRFPWLYNGLKTFAWAARGNFNALKDASKVSDWTT